MRVHSGREVRLFGQGEGEGAALKATWAHEMKFFCLLTVARDSASSGAYRATWAHVMQIYPC